MKMHEAAQEERKPTSLGRTRLAARFGLWPTPLESPQPWATRRFRMAWTRPFQRCQSRSLRELKQQQPKSSEIQGFFGTQPAPSPIQRCVCRRLKKCSANCFSNSRETFLRPSGAWRLRTSPSAAASRPDPPPKLETPGSRFRLDPGSPRPLSPRPGRGSGRLLLGSYFPIPGGVPAPPPSPLPPQQPRSDLPLPCPPPPLPNQRAQLPPPLRLAD